MQIAQGDGAAIESILRTLAQCTTHNQRVAQLHLLAKEMKQVCLPHRHPSHWCNSLSVCMRLSHAAFVSCSWTHQAVRQVKHQVVCFKLHIA